MIKLSAAERKFGNNIKLLKLVFVGAAMPERYFSIACTQVENMTLSENDSKAFQFVAVLSLHKELKDKTFSKRS